jgi:hypothetical protein
LASEPGFASNWRRSAPASRGLGNLPTGSRRFPSATSATNGQKSWAWVPELNQYAEDEAAIQEEDEPAHWTGRASAQRSTCVSGRDGARLTLPGSSCTRCVIAAGSWPTLPPRPFGANYEVTGPAGSILSFVRVADDPLGGQVSTAPLIVTVATPNGQESPPSVALDYWGRLRRRFHSPRAERIKVKPPSPPSAQSIQTKKKPPGDLAISP